MMKNKKKYAVVVNESSHRSFQVEAENMEEAIRAAREYYFSHSNDCVGVVDDARAEIYDIYDGDGEYEEIDLNSSGDVE